MRPVFARAYAEGDDAAAARLSHLSAAAFLIGTLVLLAALWLTWPLIDRYIFSPPLPRRRRRGNVLGIGDDRQLRQGHLFGSPAGASPFSGTVLISPSSAAFLTVGLVVVIAHFFGAIDTILANVAGELFMLGAILWIMDGPPPHLQRSDQVR